MHLPIRVVGRSAPVEVPFQLQPSFKFACFIPGHGVQEFVADLSSRDALKAEILCVSGVKAWEVPDLCVDNARAILSAILRCLGLAEVNGERLAAHGPDALTWIGIAHQAEKRTAEACKAALVHLTPVWRDRTEPAPNPHVAADILDSYYQQVQDEVLAEWKSKADHEMRDALLAASDKLTERQASGDSEVAP